MSPADDGDSEDDGVVGDGDGDSEDVGVVGVHLHHVGEHGGNIMLCHLVPGEIPEGRAVGLGWEVTEAITVSYIRREPLVVIGN